MGLSRSRSLLLFLGAMALTCSPLHAQSARDRELAEFQAELEEHVLEDGVGSIAADVVVGYELVWSHAIGFRDREREIEAAPSSAFVIAAPLDARLALGCDQDERSIVDGGQAALEHTGRGYKLPNGVVYSTVGDLSRFMAFVSGALGDAEHPRPGRTATRSPLRLGGGPSPGAAPGCQDASFEGART